MGAGLGTTEENGVLRGRLCHRRCRAPCLPSSAHLSHASPGPGRGQLPLPLIQQLLDAPAAEEDVGDFLQGPLQALPPGAHLDDGHPEPRVSQGPSEGEGQGLGEGLRPGLHVGGSSERGNGSRLSRLLSALSPPPQTS